jgi:hypothetical protein
MVAVAARICRSLSSTAKPATVADGHASGITLIARCGYRYDAIVDDGGHTVEQQQTSLAHLFKLVVPGGWYAIEDLQTSFDARLGGRASSGSRSKQQHGDRSNYTTTTIELLGQMIGWMSGDPRPVVGHGVGGVALPMDHVMPSIEHVDCFLEVCILQHYL